MRSPRPATTWRPAPPSRSARRGLPAAVRPRRTPRAPPIRSAVSAAAAASRAEPAVRRREVRRSHPQPQQDEPVQRGHRSGVRRAAACTRWRTAGSGAATTVTIRNPAHTEIATAKTITALVVVVVGTLAGVAGDRRGEDTHDRRNHQRDMPIPPHSQSARHGEHRCADRDGDPGVRSRGSLLRPGRRRAAVGSPRVRRPRRTAPPPSRRPPPATPPTPA